MLVNKLVIVSVVWGLKYSNMTISLAIVHNVYAFGLCCFLNWSWKFRHSHILNISWLWPWLLRCSNPRFSCHTSLVPCLWIFSHVSNIFPTFPPSPRFFRRTFPPRFTVPSSVWISPPPELNTSDRWDWTRGDVSSKDKLCDQPLVQDLYEYLRVEVRESTIRSDTCYQSGIGGMMKLEDLCWDCRYLILEFQKWSIAWWW